MHFVVGLCHWALRAVHTAPPGPHDQSPRGTSPRFRLHWHLALRTLDAVLVDAVMASQGSVTMAMPARTQLGLGKDGEWFGRWT